MTLRLAAAIAVCAVAAAADATREVAPSCDAIAGWTQHGASRLYEGDNLFEYMDGNSEGYLIYGFVRMRGVTCARGSETILIDISEMQDAESAYGLFSSHRDVKLPAEKIGAGGQVVPRKAILVKDKYFVEIAAEAEGDHSALLRAVAKTLAEKITGSTVVPEAISWFPAEGLTAGPPRLIPESVLGIRTLKRGYMAQYGAAKAFVVTEASVDAAKDSMEKLRARFPQVLSVAVGDEGFQGDDKYLGRICVARRGRRIVGYAGVPDAVGLTMVLIGRVER